MRPVVRCPADSARHAMVRPGTESVPGTFQFPSMGCGRVGRHQLCLDGVGCYPRRLFHAGYVHHRWQFNQPEIDPTVAESGAQVQVGDVGRSVPSGHVRGRGPEMAPAVAQDRQSLELELGEL